MSITKTIRFEVFKRDNFQCQYCGKQPPGITLEIDHILPRRKKGKDDIENLITSCFDCNRGKGARSLGVAPLSIQKRLELSKEKENQLIEFYKHQDKIHRRIQKDVNSLCDLWEKLSCSESEISEYGKQSIKNLLKTFSKFQIKEAMEITWGTTYVEKEGKFKYMCGILWTKKRAEDDDKES